MRFSLTFSPGSTNLTLSFPLPAPPLSTATPTPCMVTTLEATPSSLSPRPFLGALSGCPNSFVAKLNGGSGLSPRQSSISFEEEHWDLFGDFNGLSSRFAALVLSAEYVGTSGNPALLNRLILKACGVSLRQRGWRRRADTFRPARQRGHFCFNDIWPEGKELLETRGKVKEREIQNDLQALSWEKPCHLVTWISRSFPSGNDEIEGLHFFVQWPIEFGDKLTILQDLKITNVFHDLFNYYQVFLTRSEPYKRKNCKFVSSDILS